jgi:hypothetical protein
MGSALANQFEFWIHIILVPSRLTNSHRPCAHPVAPEGLNAVVRSAAPGAARSLVFSAAAPHGCDPRAYKSHLRLPDNRCLCRLRSCMSGLWAEMGHPPRDLKWRRWLRDATLGARSKTEVHTSTARMEHPTQDQDQRRGAVNLRWSGARRGAGRGRVRVVKGRPRGGFCGACDRGRRR